MPPSVWDARADTNLLISIIEILNPKPPNWKEVAEKIKEKGYDGFTHEACRQHYQKLRKDAVAAKNGSSSNKGTPSKTPGSRKSSKSKNVDSPFNGSTGDDIETYSETPKTPKTPTQSKKRKRAETIKEEITLSKVESVYGSGGPKFKAEAKNDDDGFEILDDSAFHF